MAGEGRGGGGRNIPCKRRLLNLFMSAKNSTSEKASAVRRKNQKKREEIDKIFSFNF